MYASSSFEASSFELASLAIYASTEAVGADLVVMMISSICVWDPRCGRPAARQPSGRSPAYLVPHAPHFELVGSLQLAVLRIVFSRDLRLPQDPSEVRGVTRLGPLPDRGGTFCIRCAASWRS